MKTVKWKWIFLGLSFICVNCKTVRTELIIPAEPEVVWAMLTDESSYKDWHKVLVPLEGEKLQEGHSIRYTMTANDGSKSVVEAEVVKMVKGKKLNQSGGIPGILTFDHNYLLEPTEGGTLLIQHEEYRGIFVPFWDASWVEPAYQKSNEALKERLARMNQ